MADNASSARESNMARDRTWTKTIEEHGVRIRLFERATGATVYLEYRREDGSRLRKSTRTGNRKEAERVARAVASELAEDRVLGRSRDPITLGELFRAYERHRLPHLPSEARRQFARTRQRLFLEAWGENTRVDNISQPSVDHFQRMRVNGEIAPTHTRQDKSVRLGSVDGDFRWLRAVFNWARRFKIDGRPLVSTNPMHEVEWEKEKNPMRPVASHQRFVETLKYVDTIDASGRLRCMLNLARYTGRRESAMCRLRASDFLRDEAAIRRVLAAMGFNENDAQHMPHGAIRWRDEHDKMGFATVAPLGHAMREAVDEYLEQNPRVGEAWLFPAPRDDSKPLRRDRAATWLLRAEKLAKLPKLARGAWHPYRRLWATERKHLPDTDVAAAGGWRDTATLRLSYQQTDPATVLKVVEAQS